jgi:hypothetical protein
VRKKLVMSWVMMGEFYLKEFEKKKEKGLSQ